jgi:hypothetical protein
MATGHKKYKNSSSYLNEFSDIGLLVILQLSNFRFGTQFSASFDWSLWKNWIISNLITRKGKMPAYAKIFNKYYLLAKTAPLLCPKKKNDQKCCFSLFIAKISGKLEVF